MESLTRLSVAIDTFRYPDGTTALEDIRLEVRAGDFCGLLGANGSGKTTLLKIMDGLIRDYRGSVLLDGHDILRLHPRDIYRKVGLVFQNPESQILCTTVAEEVAFGPENLCVPPAEIARRIRKSLRGVGLDGCEERHVERFSAGQKQRLAIAAVLSMNPTMLDSCKPL